ncbi:MAG: hypothetical protein QE509_09815 [Gammaproteobacteria bacterium]|nr:hypothetical protein [Gammaproteobacteria bacterium]
MDFNFARGLPRLNAVAAAFVLVLVSHTAHASTVVPSDATSWTLDSTSFAFDAGISQNYTASNGDLINRLRTSDPGAPYDLVGAYTVNNPSGLFPALGNSGDWTVVGVRVRARIEDGDSASAADYATLGTTTKIKPSAGDGAGAGAATFDLDLNALQVVLSKGGSGAVPVTGLFLNGFRNNANDTALNSITLSPAAALGKTLADMLAQNGAVSFMINDSNEGANNLYFYPGNANRTDASGRLFNLSFDLQRVLPQPVQPVPLPAGIVLLGSALLAGAAARRKG